MDAEAGFDAEDMALRICLFEAAAGTGKGPAGPHAADEHVDAGEIGEDLCARGLVMGDAVFGAIELAEVVGPGFRGDLLRCLSRGLDTSLARNTVDRCAVDIEELGNLGIALSGTHTSTGCPEVPEECKCDAVLPVDASTMARPGSSRPPARADPRMRTTMRS